MLTLLLRLLDFSLPRKGLNMSYYFRKFFPSSIETVDQYSLMALRLHVVVMFLHFFFSSKFSTLPFLAKSLAYFLFFLIASFHSCVIKGTSFDLTFICFFGRCSSTICSKSVSQKKIFVVYIIKNFTDMPRSCFQVFV